MCSFLLETGRNLMVSLKGLLCSSMSSWPLLKEQPSLSTVGDLKAVENEAILEFLVKASKYLVKIMRRA